MTQTNWAGTPEGSRDWLFDECQCRRTYEQKITDVFSHNGYSEVMTPTLEYYDTIAQSGSPIAQEAMVKLVDREGKILVMRPDNTTPIARLVGTRLKAQEPPFRLYYSQPVYRSDASHKGADSQRWQIGLELLGVEAEIADKEILRLLDETIAACGLDNAHIEIGHADKGAIGPSTPLNYYTGLIFDVYIHGVGTPIITGGRYDNLLSKFGRDLPAVGFAVDLEALSEVCV
ncbi:MAG: ATP phosphoribosyltransferase regulatory subunit [Oscillospiraceae bacterium]|nr:ATP phosphoribosyltransferase regulatory subunit [Oscillospiraceae bacterium]